MDTTRRTAIIAGVLFIVATVASLMGTSVLGSILDGPDYLAKLAANGNQVTTGALLAILAAVTSASIAISLYPVLKKHNEALALGAVGFRLIESVFYLVDVLGLLVLWELSREFVNAGMPATSGLQSLGNLIVIMRDRAGFVIAVVAFALGAMMYYYVFYRSKLIPRWLSGWGMIAAALILLEALLTMLGGRPFTASGVTLLLVLPIALQEMVLAMWLIVKGFNPSAIAVQSAGTHAVGASLK